MRSEDPLLWLRMAESCMCAAAAQLPGHQPPHGRSEAAEPGCGRAGELLEQAAQCLAEALARSYGPDVLHAPMVFPSCSLSAVGSCSCKHADDISAFSEVQL